MRRPSRTKAMRLFAAILLELFALQMRLVFAADDPLSAGANSQFLTAHAREQGVSVRQSGLQFRILKNGFGIHPSSADTVQISYSAYLIDGKLVDRAPMDLPATLPLSSALRGMSEALQMMHVGDRWELVLPADLALGSKGTANGIIPPNQVLIFDVTLLAVMPPQAGGAQDTSPLAIFGRERGKDTEAGAMLRITP
jgi:FKBP-type peptidyl-prolyl cis-trans isomerase